MFSSLYFLIIVAGSLCIGVVLGARLRNRSRKKRPFDNQAE